MWEFYKFIQKLIYSSKPNLGHISIANFQKIKTEPSYVLTRNIDWLHERAGSKNIMELHGIILKVECTNCNFKGKIKQNLKESLPPICEICKNILRPSVIFFGEPVNQEIWEIAEYIS